MHKMIYGVIGFRPISVVVLPFIVLYLALRRLRRGGALQCQLPKSESLRKPILHGALVIAK